MVNFTFWVFLAGEFKFVAVFTFGMPMRQSAKRLHLFLVEMSGLMCSIPFCIFATGGESNRDVVLFLDMVTLSDFLVFQWLFS